MSDPTPLETKIEDKVFLVTGATSGLGKATALALAEMGARVVIIGRRAERLNISLEEMRASTPSACVEGLLADLSAQQSVREVATQFLQRYDRLDGLINNVGATILQYQESPDGIEMTWALNYLNHFLLTHLLLEQLQQTAREHGEARIVSIASNMYKRSDPSSLGPQSKEGYNGVMAYSQSKRAMVMSNRELGWRLQGTGVAVNTMTPGLVATGVASNNHEGWAKVAMRVLNAFATPLDKGILPIVRLASAPELKGVTGQYFVRFEQQPPDPTCARLEDVERLWKLSCRMTGIE